MNSNKLSQLYAILRELQNKYEDEINKAKEQLHKQYTPHIKVVKLFILAEYEVVKATLYQYDVKLFDPEFNKKYVAGFSLYFYKKPSDVDFNGIEFEDLLDMLGNCQFGVHYLFGNNEANEFAANGELVTALYMMFDEE